VNFKINKMHIHCPHFKKCSGCQYENQVETPELLFRARHFLKNEFDVALPLKTGLPTSWRTRAKLAVRGAEKKLIGLFEKGSHRVYEIPHCQVHHPRINEAARCFKKAFEESPLSGYEENTQTGDVRYLQLIVERRTNKVQLTCVLNGKRGVTAASKLLKELFYQDKTHLWHSLWININQEKTNRIFGPLWEKIAGEELLFEEIAGREFAFGPEHFGQANLAMYEEMIKDIEERVPPGKKVVELYGGIGVIGVCLAKEAHSVQICEIEKKAEPYFEIAKKHLPLAEQHKLSYRAAPAEKSQELLYDSEVCVVDPPRKGLGAVFLEEILSLPTLERLIYISCDWHSLERDCQTIRKSHPEWRLKEAISYLFFPGTNQIETAAFFEK
jgi:23S rRNA (uracil1939-C5)-methyltransferase